MQQATGCNEPVAQGVDRSGRPFSYCGWSHAQAALKGGIAIGAAAAGQGMMGVRLMPGGSGQQAPNVGGASAPVRGPAQPGQPTCKLPGCQFPRKVAPNGTPFDYCSKTCAQQDQRRNVDRVWSGSQVNPCFLEHDETFSCGAVVLAQTRAYVQGFELFVLNPQHCKCAGVVKQFTDVWTSSPKPRVVRGHASTEPQAGLPRVRAVPQRPGGAQGDASVPRDEDGVHVRGRPAAEAVQQRDVRGVQHLPDLVQPQSVRDTPRRKLRERDLLLPAQSEVAQLQSRQPAHGRGHDNARPVPVQGRGGQTPHEQPGILLKRQRPRQDSHSRARSEWDLRLCRGRVQGPGWTVRLRECESIENQMRRVVRPLLHLHGLDIHETVVYNQRAAILSYVIVYEMP